MSPTYSVCKEIDISDKDEETTYEVTSRSTKSSPSAQSLPSSTTLFINFHLTNTDVKALHGLTIWTIFQRVLALTETPDLWGGRLKQFETPKRETAYHLTSHFRNLLTRPPRNVRLSPPSSLLNGTSFNVS